MDTKVVEVNKNILITSAINIANVAGASQTLPFTINVEFIPDCVVIKSIGYNSLAGEVGIGYFSSDLVGNRNIGSFQDTVCYTPNTLFLLQRPINGNYNFTFTNVNAVARTGIISIMLEFVKYKEGKEGKEGKGKDGKIRYKVNVE